MSRYTFFCIDAHTCGNPVRLVTTGLPPLEGATMMEKRQHFLEEFDWIRTGLMFEPRGHDQMSGSLLYPSSRDDCDIAVLFIETSGCLPMCGHATIGTVTMAIEHGLVRPREPGKLMLDTPAGPVEAHYELRDGRVDEVRLVNVPSYLHASGLTAECVDLGEVTVDVAYGGNFYAIVDPQPAFQDLTDHSTLDLIRWSLDLRNALNAKYEFVHVQEPAITGLTHIMWTGSPVHRNATARNAVFYGDRAIDRSPCGTGTSARMAQWAAQNRLRTDDTFVHESIIGSLFRGRIEAVTRLGDKPAIVPSITGWAKVIGLNTIFVDDRDPFAHGFTVR